MNMLFGANNASLFVHLDHLGPLHHVHRQGLLCELRIVSAYHRAGRLEQLRIPSKIIVVNTNNRSK